MSETRESVKKSFVQAAEAFGQFDYCCNCAGLAIVGDSQVLSTDSFDTMHRVNTRGLWLCQKEEVKQMLRQESSGSA
jgi:NADP-dependent 3-hydroxy acid dehydrogenase YdfG